MTNPITAFKGLDKGDRSFLVGSIFVPLVLWWFYFGRQKYGTKGLK